MCGIVLFQARTKSQNTYHLGLMYEERDKGVWGAEEGPGKQGVAEHPLIKLDGDELLTEEADGESHLPWQRCKKQPKYIIFIVCVGVLVKMHVNF